MKRKLSVAALDTPARDQPVAAVMGWRKTASDIIAPTATQPMRAPIATTTQPYWIFMLIVVRGAAKSTSPGRRRIGLLQRNGTCFQQGLEVGEDLRPPA